MMKVEILLISLFLFIQIGFSQKIGQKELKVSLGETAWYCGVVNHGELMPLAEGYFADFNGNYGNQVQPLLIANDGQTVWSEQAFKVFMDNDTLYTESDRGGLIYNKSGNTLREAFQYASKTYFPPGGKIPDELLFSAPQYNTWIELMYDQNQVDIMRYASDIKNKGYPPGVLMIDDNWQEDYGKWDFHPGRCY